MKTIHLGNTKKKTEITIMDAAEFKKFMSGKTVYHHQCGWIEKWNQPMKDLLGYFPHSGFTLSSRLTLKPYEYAGYPSNCLGHSTKSGKPYWECERYKVTIRKFKTGNKYYVTKFSNV